MKKTLILFSFFFFSLSFLNSLKASNVISIKEIIRKNKKKQKTVKHQKNQSPIISMEKLRLLKAITQPSVESIDFDPIKDIIEEKKFDQNQALNEKGETLLHLAIKNRRYHITDFLLKENQQSTNVNVQDEKGKAAIHHLVSLQNRQKHSSLFSGITESSYLEQDYLGFQDHHRKDLLLEKRNDMIEASRKRMVMSHIVKESRLDSKTRQRLLNFDENVKHLYYITVPYTFTLSILYDLVNLEKLQVDFNLKDKQGRTALMIALSNPHLIGQDAIFKYLINRSDVSLTDHSGNTALYYALQSGNFQAFDLLYQKEANLNHHNYKNNNLLHEAFLKLIEMRRIKQKQKTDPEKIQAKKDLEKMLLEGNILLAKIKTKDKPKVYPYSLVMEVVQKLGFESIITYLMVKKETSLELRNKEGFLPIHLLAQLGDKNLLTHILKEMNLQGMDVLAKDYHGKHFIDYIQSLTVRKQMKEFIDNQTQISNFSSEKQRVNIIRLRKSQKARRSMTVRR